MRDKHLSIGHSISNWTIRLEQKAGAYFLQSLKGSAGHNENGSSSIETIVLQDLKNTKPLLDCTKRDVAFHLRTFRLHCRTF